MVFSCLSWSISCCGPLGFLCLYLQLSSSSLPRLFGSGSWTKPSARLWTGSEISPCGVRLEKAPNPHPAASSPTSSGWRASSKAHPTRASGTGESLMASKEPFLPSSWAGICKDDLMAWRSAAWIQWRHWRMYDWRLWTWGGASYAKGLDHRLGAGDLLGCAGFSGSCLACFHRETWCWGQIWGQLWYSCLLSGLGQSMSPATWSTYCRYLANDTGLCGKF